MLKNFAIAFGVLGFVIFAPTTASAEVSVKTGPTSIIGGTATDKKDITVSNNKFGFSISVGSADTWGMANGTISDIGFVQPSGKIGPDKIFNVQFLVDTWTVSDTDYLVDVKIEKSTKDEAVISVQRKYDRKGLKPLNITTKYSLKDNEDALNIETTMENPKDGKAYKGLYSGYTLSKEIGYMFGPFGYNTPDEKAKYIITSDEDSQYVAAYDKDFVIGLYMPGSDRYAGRAGYKDLMTYTSIEPGATVKYSAVVSLQNNGNYANLLSSVAKSKKIDLVKLSGKVSDEKGAPISNAVVVVERNGQYQSARQRNNDTLEEIIATPDTKISKNLQTYTWAQTDANGNYIVSLPKGEYKVSTMGDGINPSEKRTVVINNKPVSAYFDKLSSLKMAMIKTVDSKTGKPVDAKIRIITETTPAVKYAAKSTYFTDIKNIGVVTIGIPKDAKQISVESGSLFQSLSVLISPKDIENEKVVKIEKLIDPKQANWFAADLHHHSNLADGATTPLTLVESELASRLDVIVVTDHDSIANQKEIRDMAKSRDTLCMPGLEVSPGWAHTNVFKKDGSLFDKTINPSISGSEILAEAKANNIFSVANHPYTSYGYYYNYDKIPGGYSPNYDLIEIQSTYEHKSETNSDYRTLKDAMDSWTAYLNGTEYKKFKLSKPYYLSAGSDSHDVTTNIYSGSIREYVNINDKLVTEKTFIDNLLKGHSYVSTGPILFPDVKNGLFGEKYVAKDGKYNFNFNAQSVSGLTKVEIYKNGEIIKTIDYNKLTDLQKISYSVPVDKKSWISIVALDNNGNVAISNPVWLDIK